MPEIIMQTEEELQRKVQELQALVEKLQYENDSIRSEAQSQEAASTQSSALYLSQEEFEKRLADITRGAAYVTSWQAAQVLNLLAGYRYNDWRNHYHVKSVQSHIKYGNLKALTEAEQIEIFGTVIPHKAFYPLDAVLTLPIAPWRKRGGLKPDGLLRYPRKKKKPVEAE